jgi:hypothetical protein
MKTRPLLLLAVLSLPLMAMLTPSAVAPSLLGRTSNELSLFLLLNGVPVKLGVLTTAGTTINNSDTAVPFTVTGGTVLEVVCDAAAFVNIGSTSSSDYTNANFGRPLTAGVSRWFVLRDSDTAISVDTTSGAANCQVSVMR